MERQKVESEVDDDVGLDHGGDGDDRIQTDDVDSNRGGDQWDE